MSTIGEAKSSYISFVDTHWRPWRELSAIALMLMELSWLIAWHSAMIQTEGRLATGSLFLLYGLIVSVTYLAANILLWLHLRTIIRRAVLLIIFISSYIMMLKRLLYSGEEFSLVSILRNLKASSLGSSTFLPGEFLVLFLCAFLVFRSGFLASSWIGISIVRRRFRIGMALMLLLGGFSLFFVDTDIRLEMFIFLSSGFVALGAARISTQSTTRGGYRRQFTPKSILSIFFNAILVAGMVFVLGEFTSATLATMVAIVFLFALRLFLIFIVMAFTPIYLLFSAVVGLFSGNMLEWPLFRVIELEILRVFDTIISFIGAIALFIQDLSFQLPDLNWVRPLLRWGVVVVVLFLLLRELGRRGFSLRMVRDERLQESAPIDGQAVRAWLKRFFSEQARRFSSRLSFLDKRRYLGALRIRRIYTQLMWLCERLGRPRPEAATPLEYIPDLELLFPEARSEVKKITHAYNQVRYGELPETAEDIQAVELAWRRVRKKGNDLLLLKRQLAREGHG
jgi:hypothetical protein